MKHYQRPLKSPAKRDPNPDPLSKTQRILLPLPGAKGPGFFTRLFGPIKNRFGETGLRFSSWRMQLDLIEKEHPGIHFSIKVALCGALFVVLAAAVMGLIYFGKAYRYDLEKVAHVQGGADVVDWSGTLVGRIVPKNRKIVELEDVPAHLIDALLATEDERFYEHEGYDFWGMARAGMINLRSRRIRQGASTITQQLARNACALTERNFDRKFTEILLAWRIERAYSKSEILVGYLNRIYWGRGYWGIGAAAEGYFAKEVADLDLGESAMLCGIIKSPNPFSPFSDYDKAIAARDDTLNRMVRSGLLEPEARDEWVSRRTEVRRFKQQDTASSYVLAQIGREAHRLLVRDSLEDLVIETSLDVRIQGQVESAVEQTLLDIEATNEFRHPTRSQFVSGEVEMKDGVVPYLQAAVLVLENATGDVVAAVGTRNHRESEFDRVWRSFRPAGSSFLPILYASAFENPDLSPQTLVLDAPLDNREVMVGGRSGILGEWLAESPENRFEGQMPAAWAFLRGKTSATMRLGFETGLLPMHHLAQQAGIASTLREYPSSFLGSSEVNLAELTHAYTMFPNLGWRSSRSGLIRKITTTDGTTVYDGIQANQPVRVVQEVTAAQLNSLMTESLPQSGLHGARPEVQGQLAGKTGTTYDGNDHWFLGYNSQFTWGVWVGFDLPIKISDRLSAKETAFTLWSTLASSLDSGEPLLRPRNAALVSICPHNCSDCQNPEHAKISCPISTQPRATIIAAPDEGIPAIPIQNLEPTIVIPNPAPQPIQLSRPTLQGDDPYGALGSPEKKP